jgi:predicted ATP-grasp superfamily ATP-dependent carboligase
MRVPRILIVTMATDWPAAARLAAGLQHAGFAVLACCPRDSFLAATRFVERFVLFEDGVAFGTLAQLLVDLVEQERLDLLIPGDDFAIWLLHRLHRDLARLFPAAPVTQILERSLCALDRQAELELKTRLPETAAALGIRIPAQIIEPSWAQAMDFATLHGAPVVVKLDRTWGGAGVRVCSDEAALQTALAYIPPALAALGVPARRLLQRYIPGRTAVVVLVAWRGVVLSAFAVVKLHSHPEQTGPSSVVARLDDPRLLDSAAQLVRHFSYSGFADVEFRLEAGNGEPYLIEINPRAQPLCHLGQHFGADLCAALFAAVTGAPPPPAVEIADDRPVALFPNEWCRDPSSPYLASAYHDVPWQDPALLRRLVEFGERQNSVAATSVRRS